MRLSHNCRVKRYPDGSADIVAASAPFGGGDLCRFSREGEDGGPPPVPWDEQNNPALREARRIAREEAAYASLERVAIEDDGPDDRALEARRMASLERAKRRARVAVRDLGLCNDFRYFVTLTLDPAKINRYDPREVVRHLNHWLDNNVRRRGLKYVLVPEHHKDGAIHFHGFFNDALEAVDSGHKDRKGHTVYNLPGWGWGFSTAIELYGQRAAAVAYTCKYIAKAQEKIGGRWYYSGGDLKRPDIVWCDVDYDHMLGLSDGKPFEVPGVHGIQFIQIRTDVSHETGAGSEDMREAASRFACMPHPPSRPCVRCREEDRPGATPDLGRGLDLPPLVKPPRADDKKLDEFDNFRIVNRAAQAPPRGAAPAPGGKNDLIKREGRREPYDHGILT